MSTTTLDLDNIQGDVLQGLPKRYQSFLFFSVTNPTQFRKRFNAIVPFITTTTQVKADEAAIAAHKASGALGLLKLVGTNVAFSSAGLIALGITDDLGDDHFKAGQLQDASLPSLPTPPGAAAGGISDPGIVKPDGTVDPAWDPVFKQTIHGCFLITGDSNLTIAARIVEIEAILIGTIKTLAKVDGAVRPGAEAGHEHFGFQDGLSNPPVDGFRPPNTGEVATAPGVILLGEIGDGVKNASRSGWAKDSSFLVFRKLQQFVPEFNDFLATHPIPDPELTPAQGSELLGARLVGRWKSGAPVERNPKQDSASDAADVNKVNDFDYSDDPAQIRCPFTAHLRKMNPRSSGVPPLAAVQQRRIIRQGIPYGPEVDPAESHSKSTKHDRGLLFTCYQSNIQLGFHFLQNAWANNPGFPGPNDGFDAIIGQQVPTTPSPRTTSGTDPLNVTTALTLPLKAFVVPLGGEYFLSPSISALKTKISSA